MTGRQEYDRNMTGRQDDRQYDRQRILNEYMIDVRIYFRLVKFMTTWRLNLHTKRGREKKRCRVRASHVKILQKSMSNRQKVHCSAGVVTRYTLKITRERGGGPAVFSWSWRPCSSYVYFPCWFSLKPKQLDLLKLFKKDCLKCRLCMWCSWIESIHHRQNLQK